MPVIGTLPANLHGHPALLQVQLGPTRVAERIVAVVRVEKILDACGGLPDRHARVRVLQGGDAAVRVDGRVGFLLHGGEVEQ